MAEFLDSLLPRFFGGTNYSPATVVNAPFQQQLSDAVAQEAQKQGINVPQVPQQQPRGLLDSPAFADALTALGASLAQAGENGLSTGAGIALGSQGFNQAFNARQDRINAAQRQATQDQLAYLKDISGLRLGREQADLAKQTFDRNMVVQDRGYELDKQRLAQDSANAAAGRAIQQAQLKIAQGEYDIKRGQQKRLDDYYKSFSPTVIPDENGSISTAQTPYGGVSLPSNNTSTGNQTTNTTPDFGPTPQQRAALAAGALKPEDFLKDQAKRKENYNTDITNFNTVNDSLTNLETTIKQLQANPRLNRLTGLDDYIPNWKGGGTADAEAKLENIKGRIGLNALQTLRAASSTGSSGFGSLTEKEGARLDNSIASLDKSQSDEQFAQSLNTILENIQQSRTRLGEGLQRQYNYNPLAEGAGGKNAPQAYTTPSGVKYTVSQ